MVAKINIADAGEVPGKDTVYPVARPLPDPMSNEIRARMNLPADQWIDMEKDRVFDDVIALLHERGTSG